MIILAIESTCDETGVAILEGPSPGETGIPRVISSVVSSQIALHKPYGGVVPEIAARAHLRNLLPVMDEALKRASITLKDVHAIAVATRPGLVGALIVGLTAAKSLALALDVPLIPFDHLEGHLYACQLAYPEQSAYPCVGLVVSGGHTSLFHCRSPVEYELLGGTIDDAAGEAFDKIASLLGLGYPGGPEIERVARTGNPLAYSLPRAFLHDETIAFSFSGLKTAVLYTLNGQNGRQPALDPTPQTIADLAASFQEAVVDVLMAKARQALRKTGLKRLGIGGGVAANARFREKITEMAARESVELLIPPMSLCTDNAALGAIAFAKCAGGEVSDLGVDVTPGLVRPHKKSASRSIPTGLSTTTEPEIDPK